VDCIFRKPSVLSIALCRPPELIPQAVQRIGPCRCGDVTISLALWQGCTVELRGWPNYHTAKAALSVPRFPVHEQMSPRTSLSVSGLGVAMWLPVWGLWWWPPNPYRYPPGPSITRTVEGLSKDVFCELESQLVSSADFDIPFFRCRVSVYSSIMFPNLRLPPARYTLLGDDNDSGKKTSSGSRTRGSQFFAHLVKCWRELAILGLCIVCAFLTFEHSLKPFGGGTRAQVKGYRKCRQLWKGDSSSYSQV
jgi:hypothetical protein